MKNIKAIQGKLQVSFRKSYSRQVMLSIITALFVLLWSYAAISKWLEFEEFKRVMAKQPLTQQLSTILPYILPTVEALIAILLLTESHRKLAFQLSILLLSTFSVYILLGISGFFGQVPCACGGLLTQMGWFPHLIFNLTYVALGIWAVHRIDKS